MKHCTKGVDRHYLSATECSITPLKTSNLSHISAAPECLASCLVRKSLAADLLNDECKKPGQLKVIVKAVR